MSATSDLVKKLAAGDVKVVVAADDYAGQRVTYSPRNAKDRLPWVLANPGTADDETKRFSGKECRTESL